jgi:hypothetical protein
LGFLVSGVEAVERGRFVSGEDTDLERKRDDRTGVGNFEGRVIARSLDSGMAMLKKLGFSRWSMVVTGEGADARGQLIGVKDLQLFRWERPKRCNCNLKKTHTCTDNCP